MLGGALNWKLEGQNSGFNIISTSKHYCVPFRYKAMGLPDTETIEKKKQISSQRSLSEKQNSCDMRLNE